RTWRGLTNVRAARITCAGPAVTEQCVPKRPCGGRRCQKSMSLRSSPWPTRTRLESMATNNVNDRDEDRPEARRLVRAGLYDFVFALNLASSFGYGLLVC